MYPLSYTSPVEEHQNTRTNVGMQDLSTMGEVDIKGPGAERLVNRLLVNEVRDMEPGMVRYSTMCNEMGGIVDDITVYKFGEEHFLIVTSSGPRKKTARWIADHALGMSAYVTDVTGAIGLLSVQGPRSQDYLLTVVEDVDLQSLRFFRFTQGRINQTEVLISRSGYTGELGYELYVPSDEAAVLWEYIAQTGQDFGLMPYGVQTMQSLRIEKAFPLYGPDIDENRSPFEVGLSRWIRFDKREFVGREALLGSQDVGLQERWTGLVVESDIAAKSGDLIYSIGDVASHREKVLTGSEAEDYEDVEKPGMMQVGTVTSSAKGHSLGKMLALGYVSTTHAWPGSRLLIDIGGRPRPATVTTTPFFDPRGVRMRARGSERD
jgi:aminomethyltransferase